MKDTRYLHIDSEVGKIVVNRCLKLGYKINTQKLEKLLVIIQGKMLAEHNKSILRSEIIATENTGIIIPKIDKDFAMYALAFTEELYEYITLLEAESKVVNSVLSAYGEYSAVELQEKTNLEKINKFCEKYINLIVTPFIFNSSMV